jgi:hypothetical protein
MTAKKEEIEALTAEKNTIEKLIDVEKQVLDNARAEYGLMNSRERETLADIAQKVGEKGVGSLSDEELTFIKGNAAFAKAIADFAKANADAQGFDEKIVQPLGLDEKLAALEEDRDRTVDMINTINIDIKNIDSLAADIEAKLKPKLEELTLRIYSKLRADLHEIGEKIRNRDF